MTCGKEFELQPIRNAYRLTHDTRDSTHKFVLQSFVLLTPRSYVAVDRNVTSNAEQRPLLSDRHSEFRSDLRKTLLAYLSLGGKNREVGNRPRGENKLGDFGRVLLTPSPIFLLSPVRSRKASGLRASVQE